MLVKKFISDIFDKVLTFLNKYQWLIILTSLILGILLCSIIGYFEVNPRLYWLAFILGFPALCFFAYILGYCLIYVGIMKIIDYFKVKESLDLDEDDENTDNESTNV